MPKSVAISCLMQYRNLAHDTVIDCRAEIQLYGEDYEIRQVLLNALREQAMFEELLRDLGVEI